MNMSRWTTGCGSCSSDTDYRVSVSPDDIAGYLLNKICGGTNITISEGGTPGARCVVIDGPVTHIPTVVTSTDATVTVVYDAPTNTYDLSVNCCDQDDKFVAVNAGCTPGYLIDQIEAAPGSSIIVSQNGCKVELDFDASAIPDLDRKVAVDSTCTAGFLEDQLTAGDGIAMTKSACQLEIGLDGSSSTFERPWARIILQNTVQVYGIAPNTTGDQLIIGLSGVPVTDTSDPAMLATANAVTITKTGPYVVSFKGIVEVNDHIHAFRVALIANATVNNSLLDHKYSAGFSGGTFTGGNPLPLYNGDGAGCMIYSVGQSAILNLNAGDVLALYIKYDTNVDNAYTAHATGDINIVGNDGTINTQPVIGGSIGLTLSVSYAGALIV